MKKTITNETLKRLSSYSAMGATYLLTAGTSDGAVIYTDVVPDIVINNGEAVYLDMDGDAVTDFAFQVYSISSVWSFGEVFGYIPILSIGNASDQMIGYYGAILPYANALNSGSVVGPVLASSLYFLNDVTSYNVAFLASTYFGSTYGQFADVTDKFLGVKFIAGDGMLHYGWVRLDATVTPVTITIKDFAYESEPNTEIITTLPSLCDVPTSLYADGITSNSAVMHWDAMAGANQYVVSFYNVAIPGVIGKQRVATTSYDAAGNLLPSTTYAFRVKTVCYDLGIKSEYSEWQYFTTAPLRMAESSEQNVVLYPNPASGNVNLQLSGYNGKTEVGIYNNVGELVYEKTIEISEPFLNDMIELNYLSAGLYHVKITNNSTTTVENLMIAK